MAGGILRREKGNRSNGVCGIGQMGIGREGNGEQAERGAR